MICQIFFIHIVEHYCCNYIFFYFIYSILDYFSNNLYGTYQVYIKKICTTWEAAPSEVLQWAEAEHRWPREQCTQPDTCQTCNNTRLMFNLRPAISLLYIYFSIIPLSLYFKLICLFSSVCGSGMFLREQCIQPDTCQTCNNTLLTFSLRPAIFIDYMYFSIMSLSL